MRVKYFKTIVYTVVVAISLSWLGLTPFVQKVEAQSYDGNSCYGAIRVNVYNTRTGQTVNLRDKAYYEGPDNNYETMDVMDSDSLNIDASVSAEGPSCVISTAFLSGGGTFSESGSSYINLGLFAGVNTTYIVSSNDSGIYGENSVSCNYGGGYGCYGSDYFGMVYLQFNMISAPQPDFSIACSPSTRTINSGDTTSFNISTTSINGFNSTVNISHSISGSGTKPTVSSYVNNDSTPDAVTTAVISTTGSTSSGTYTIVFNGTGGGQTHTCTSQVQVIGQPAGFTLSVSPASNSVLKGSNSSFTVTANCTGSFTGPVTNLSASSFYTNVTYTFSSSSVACGQSVTLTVGNTSAVPSNQLSTPQSVLPQTITVTGQGS